MLKKPFSQIITGNDDLLFKLRHKDKFLKGKCGLCQYKSICGGCRVRAKFVYKDIWQEDPSCYLTEEEVKSKYGISSVPSAPLAAE